MIILTPNANYKFHGRDNKEDPSDDHDLDWKVIKETWVENVYHLEEDMFPNGIFVDLGANIGSVSLFVDNFNHSRDKKLPPIVTYAVEPEPNNLKYLKKNMKTNPVTKNINVIKKAVCNETGIVKITNRGGNSSLLNVDDFGYSEVGAVTLGDLLNDNGIELVDVLKVDIEGSEYDLIIDTPNNILTRCGFITIEFDPNNDGRFGVMIDKLSRNFGIQILGSPERGGYIFARKY